MSHFYSFYIFFHMRIIDFRVMASTFFLCHRRCGSCCHIIIVSYHVASYCLPLLSLLRHCPASYLLFVTTTLNQVAFSLLEESICYVTDIVVRYDDGEILE